MVEWIKMKLCMQVGLVPAGHIVLVVVVVVAVVVVEMNII